MARCRSPFRITTTRSALILACAMAGAGAQAQTSTDGLAMFGEARLSNLTFTLVSRNPFEDVPTYVQWQDQWFDQTSSVALDQLDTTQHLTWYGTNAVLEGSFGVQTGVSTAYVESRIAAIDSSSWGDFTVGGTSVQRTTNMSQPSIILSGQTSLLIRGTWSFQGHNDIDALLAPIAGKDTNPADSTVAASLKIGLAPRSATLPVGSVSAEVPTGTFWNFSHAAGSFSEGGTFEIGMANYLFNDVELVLNLAASVTLSPNFGGYVPPSQVIPDPPIAIPEPTTWAQMALGLMGLGAVATRRARRQAATHG